jgi:hypothetical protein
LAISVTRELLTPLLLVLVANTAAWGAARALGSRWGAPLDCELRLADGSRLLGSHKTWRGLIAAALACALVTYILNRRVALGATFGMLALLGDAGSSFVKRRLHLRPGTEVPLLDQVPEALLPLLVLAGPLGIGGLQILVTSTLFVVLDLATMKLRHR